MQSLRHQITVEKTQGNPQTLAALLELEERYAVRAYGAALPGFLTAQPANFAVKDKAKSIRFLAFGDFGTGKDDQKRLASAMRAEHKKKAFDFGITLGDNFYGNGMYSPSDARWQRAYYSYVAGPVEFFVLNTEVMVEKQLNWLKEGLEKSRAKWKIVYAHHPIYSGSRENNPDLVERLLPVIRGKADAYLAGHDHVLAHLKAEEGTEFFVSGGGGASKYKIREDNPLELFGEAAFGFLAVDVMDAAMRFRFIGPENQTLYEYTAKKVH